jgi:hypothetical protein
VCLGCILRKRFLQGVEAAVLSRNRLDLRVKTRAATLHAAEIDCPFGKRLFWPSYRSPNADEIFCIS